MNWRKTLKTTGGCRGTRAALGALVLGMASAVVVAGAARANVTTTCQPLTQGYWKNHTSVWAPPKLTGLTLGTTFYTDTQLLTIFNTPPRGDASIILADQLIAALLNIQIIGTDPTPISATITDANTLLGAGPIPEHVASSSSLGQQMVSDANILNTFNNGLTTTACAVVTPPPGSCQPSSSLSVLVTGTNVVSYVPKGAWLGGSSGVSMVNVEGTSITPALIATANTTNSCASNPTLNQTVCTANNTDVYVIPAGNSPTVTTLSSGGSGSIGFSGGSCTNCGVAMDAVHGKALIGLSIAGAPGFQFLDMTATPGSDTFETAVASPAGSISEDPLIDPINNLLLSAAENGNYEIANIATTTSPSFFENATGGGELDSSGEDCSTEIALAPAEFSEPSNVFIADLKQATFTAGSPGTWTTTGSQVQSLSESFLSAGASGIAVAQGTHTGIVSGEFGGDAITAIALPTTSGSGTPAISDWVTCSIGSGFSNGLDPHTVTAYQSPNGSKDAIALLANGGATQLAVVDLTAMLNTTTVPRTGGGHGCASGTMPGTVVRFIPVP
jgi:hypothetical protein